MYSADNEGKLAENLPEGASGYEQSNSWVMGSMRLSTQATNETLIRQGKFFPYANNPVVYTLSGGFPASSTGSAGAQLFDELLDGEPLHGDPAQGPGVSDVHA